MGTTGSHRLAAALHGSTLWIPTLWIPSLRISPLRSSPLWIPALGTSLRIALRIALLSSTPLARLSGLPGAALARLSGLTLSSTRLTGTALTRA
ncbi:hypothetical protein [Corynebacterium sp.]|uniref:hypothetical protein n=1 Tax=Corynebacterium sp. TaxID=1720 RepID=UPI002587C072|nr:hypothetical protein [Corynebacterium sp.]